jgi:hypothetical protein
MEHQIRSYHDLGIDQVVPKPIELALLHEAIVSVLAEEADPAHPRGSADRYGESAA